MTHTTAAVTSNRGTVICSRSDTQSARVDTFMILKDYYHHLTLGIICYSYHQLLQGKSMP